MSALGHDGPIGNAPYVVTIVEVESTRRMVSVRQRKISRMKVSFAKYWQTKLSAPLSVKSSYRYRGFLSCQVRARSLSSAASNTAGLCHVCQIFLGNSTVSRSLPENNTKFESPVLLDKYLSLRLTTVYITPTSMTSFKISEDIPRKLRGATMVDIFILSHI